jgi:hypothetical protein
MLIINTLAGRPFPVVSCNFTKVLVPYAPQDTLIFSKLAFLRTKIRTFPAALVRISFALLCRCRQEKVGGETKI